MVEGKGKEVNRLFNTRGRVWMRRVGGRSFQTKGGSEIWRIARRIRMARGK